MQMGKRQVGELEAKFIGLNGMRVEGDSNAYSI